MFINWEEICWYNLCNKNLIRIEKQTKKANPNYIRQADGE